MNNIISFDIVKLVLKRFTQYSVRDQSLNDFITFSNCKWILFPVFGKYVQHHESRSRLYRNLLIEKVRWVWIGLIWANKELSSNLVVLYKHKKNRNSEHNTRLIIIGFQMKSLFIRSLLDLGKKCRNLSNICLVLQKNKTFFITCIGTLSKIKKSVVRLLSIIVLFCYRYSQTRNINLKCYTFFLSYFFFRSILRGYFYIYSRALVMNIS